MPLSSHARSYLYQQVANAMATGVEARAFAGTFLSRQAALQFARVFRLIPERVAVLHRELLRGGGQIGLERMKDLVRMWTLADAARIDLAASDRALVSEGLSRLRFRPPAELAS